MRSHVPIDLDLQLDNALPVKEIATRAPQRPLAAAVVLVLMAETICMDLLVLLNAHMDSIKTRTHLIVRDVPLVVSSVMLTIRGSVSNVSLDS